MKREMRKEHLFLLIPIFLLIIILLGVNFVNSQLIYDDQPTPVVAIDTSSRTLKDSTGTTVANYQSNILYDDSGGDSIWWSNRQLISSNSFAALDWDARMLYDENENPILNWSTGKVGIGTTSPARTLHINDTMRLQPTSSAPTNPTEGDIYFDSSLHKLCYYNSLNWKCF